MFKWRKGEEKEWGGGGGGRTVHTHTHHCIDKHNFSWVTGHIWAVFFKGNSTQKSNMHTKNNKAEEYFVAYHHLSIMVMTFFLFSKYQYGNKHKQLKHRAKLSKQALKKEEKKAMYFQGSSRKSKTYTTQICGNEDKRKNNHRHVLSA